MVTQTRTIRVVNKVEGEASIKKLARDYGRLNKNIKGTSDTMKLFRRAFQVSIAGIGIRELARAADSFQLLRDRIKVFTGDTQSANVAFKDLQRAARFTRTSVEALATSYNRVALSTQELGLNSEQIIAFTAGLQQSFRLAGSSIAEASAATIQLTQGLASGQLRGQELRSVLEQNAVVGGILAKELGTTRGQLIKFAESGKITSEVVLSALVKNIDDLNSKAGQLGTTFGQSVTVVLDAFRAKLDEVNRSLGISEKFESLALAVVDNLDVIGVAVAGLATLIVVQAIPSMILALNALKISIAQTGIGLLLIGIGTVVAALAFNWEKSVLKMERIWLEFLESVVSGAKKIINVIRRVDGFISKIRGVKPTDFSLFDVVQADLLKNISTRLGEVNVEIAKLEKAEDFGAKISKDLKSINFAAKDSVFSLGRLNLQLKSGVITLEEYDERLANFKLSELNKKFREGKIDIDQYNKSVLALSQNLQGLNPILLGAESGLRSVANTAGNIAQQISSGFINAFKSLEDALFEFTKSGELNFSKFAQAVINDLTRIVIRAQIIAPIARGIGSLLTGGAGFAGGSGGGGGVGQLPSAGGFANGGVFNRGGLTAFANGGVVSSPTIFPFANGTGLMGEAGPEAIMPLVRRNGKLGVEGGGNSVQVNVINQVGGEVEQRERSGPSGERILDIMIKEKTKEAVSSGSLDKVMAENFGLKRVGR